MVLVNVQVLIYFGIVVEDLQFHALVCRVAFEWRPDPEPVVGAGGKQEVEAEIEIAVLIFRVKVATATSFRWSYHQFIVLHHIIFFIAHPLVEVGTVKKYFESFFLFFCR